MLSVPSTNLRIIVASSVRLSQFIILGKNYNHNDNNNTQPEFSKTLPTLLPFYNSTKNANFLKTVMQFEIHM